MKLHRLELTGFGPFLDTQTVDFDAYDRDGIFLISGRTGAGKSSILDGVSFALYGSVPRYPSGGRLRSDHCTPDDPTEVRLEFTAGARRLRVTRSPEFLRPAKRGGGLTPERARAELEELVDGVWVGRAARLVDVATELDEILGLNAQQFQQVILLAQNKFSRFLLAKNDERQLLLRTLFGSRRYEEYARSLAERAKRAQRELDTLGEHARTLLDQAEQIIAAHDLGGGEDAPTELGARRDAAERARQRAEYRREGLLLERDRTETAHRAVGDAHRLLTARVTARAELEQTRAQLAALDAAADAVAADRDTLARARAAAELRAPLDAVARTAAASAAARAAADDAARAWDALDAEEFTAPSALASPGEPAGRTAQVGGEVAAADVVAAGVAVAEAGSDAVAADEVPADEVLADLVERLTGRLAVWAAAAEHEAELAVQHAERAAVADATIAREQELADLDAQRALIPAERERITAALDHAGQAAAVVDAVRGQRDELAARLDAARRAEALEAPCRAADADHVAASAATAAATAAVATLLRRRLDGHAGELAGLLVDGEPCGVCGSTAHPQPAATAAEPVTDQLVADAENARDAALERERLAADTARAARDALAAVAAQAGGVAPADLAAQLEAAQAAVSDAERAMVERDRLDAQRTELAALETASASARAALAESLAALREQLAGLDSAIARIRAEVDSARGAHATVAARLAAATVVRDAARGLLTARAEAARAATAAHESADDLAQRLTASAFVDASEATEALRGEPAIAALDAGIRDHETALAVTRQRALHLELELAGDDGETLDLEASQRALAEADAARTAAIEAERDATGVAERLRGLLLQTDDAYAVVAERAEESAALSRLSDTFAGRGPNTKKMDLETFVLAAELEEIVAAANTRLSEMSGGRYTLQHSDALAARGAASGLGIDVLDAHTGLVRPPHSLSGGETFLASLALALGLAQVVTDRAGGIRLDTLFIDEGFGSLDGETLELAMDTLDELRAGGRTVGVISHVEAMKERIAARLEVEATPRGPSIVRQDELAATPA